MENARIIKETSAGIQCYTIKDEMLRKREILLTDEVNTETTNMLITQLLYLERESKEKEITMYINSPGGEVNSGLALYDVMMAIKCPIRTVCIGIAASMGAILFLAGEKRELLAHGKILIHDPLIRGGMSGNALEIKQRAEDIMNEREILGKIIAERSGKSLEVVYKQTKKDAFLNAKQSVEFGLATKIIKSI